MRNSTKEYLIDTMNALSTDETSSVIEEQKNELISYFDDEASILEIITKVTEFMDALDDIKILGKEGIVIEYAVNKDGFVVNETGKIDLILDADGINTLVKEMDETDPTSYMESIGLYELVIDYTTENSNINGDVQIELPELTEENSFNMLDLSTMMIPDTTIDNSLNTDDFIMVILNGEILEFKESPQIIDGNTLVEARSIAEALGYEVSWDNVNKQILIKSGDKTLGFTIGSDEAKINGETVKLSTSVRLINGKTMVPLRFICESLGAEIEWDDSIRAIFIYSE